MLLVSATPSLAPALFASQKILISKLLETAQAKMNLAWAQTGTELAILNWYVQYVSTVSTAEGKLRRPGLAGQHHCQVVVR